MKAAPTGAIVSTFTHAHYTHVDGLRGLAILLVVVYHLCLPHTGFHGRDGALLLQMGQAGWMGVDLFFVLSGFLITGILLETRTQQHYFRNFLARRFLRIWPLYYASLLVLLVLLPLAMTTLPPEVQSMRDKQAWFWLYAANWLFAREGGFSGTSGGYFWSLAVEEQFYLVWPVVVYLLAPRALLRTCLALLALSLVSRIVLVQLGVSTGSLYTMTFTHLDGLAVGAAIAVCLRSPQGSQRLVRLMPWAAAAAAIGLVAVRVADRDLFFWSRQMATYGYTLVVILFGALLVAVLKADAASPLKRVFANRFLTRCGKYSYALYMVHVPVASLLYPLVRKALGRWEAVIGYEAIFLVFAVSAFAVSWGVSVASWHLFEKRILALKSRFSYRDDAVPAAVAMPRSAVHRQPG